MMIQNDVALQPYSNYRIGGPSRRFLEVKSADELTAGLREWKALGEGDDRVFILGSGCNVLIDDKGYEGLVIRNAITSLEQVAAHRLRVGSGLLLGALLTYCAERDLSGLEWAGGLPGTVGGAVVCSAGAFGGEIRDNIVAVESLDLRTLEMRTRTAGDCSFAYRESVFKRGVLREYIVAVTVELEPGNGEAILECIAEKIAYRNRCHPMDYPSVGSIFKNIPLPRIPTGVAERFAAKIKIDPFPVLPAAVLLAEAGLKGTRAGDIEISCKHPNFFVNVGRGKACDVRHLIRFARGAVNEQFRVTLEPEIVELR